MNNLHNLPEADSESVPLWKRLWPVFVGILMALVLASVGYWAGTRGNQNDEPSLTASEANASDLFASMDSASQATASEPEASGVIFQGAFTANTALHSIFGEMVNKGSASFGRWTQARLPATDEFKNLQGRGSLLVSSLGIFPIQENGETRQLMLFQSVPDDSNYGAHAEGAIIGAAVFRPIDGGWQEVRETRAITVAGSFGQAPNGKPIVLGPTQWGVLFEGSYTGQGETVNYAFIIDQSEQGFVASNQNFDMGKNNNGSCGADANNTPCYSYSATLRTNPSLSGGRYLLDLVTKGTRTDDNGQLNTVIETQQFRYQAGQYVEDPGKHVIKLKPIITEPISDPAPTPNANPAPVASPVQ